MNVRRGSKLQRLLPALLILAVCWSTGSWAQTTGPTGEKYPGRISLADESAAVLNAAILAKVAAAEDRAVGYVTFGSNKLRVISNNLGDVCGILYFYPCYIPRPGSTSSDYPLYDSTMYLGFKKITGFFDHAQVHESGFSYQDDALIDWEAPDGARGSLYSNPPQTLSGVPRYAHSTMPLTWPDLGDGPVWPAPDLNDSVYPYTGTLVDGDEGYATYPEWTLGDPWNKWALAGDLEVYTRFDDQGADRNPYSTTLGLYGRKRLIGYAALDVIFFQFEITNRGVHDLTGCYIGVATDLGQPTTNARLGMSFPEWIPAYNMLTMVGYNYDTVSGFQYRRDSNSRVYRAAWFGQMYLETPGGNYRTSGDPPALVSDPTNVINRVAVLEFNDRATENDEYYYGAISGDVSYFGEDTEKARVIWKTDQGGGLPVLMQNSDEYKTYNPGWINALDPFSYIGYGPFNLPAGDSVDFILAYIQGPDRFYFERMADLAILTYQNKMAASGPPKSPTLTVMGEPTGPYGAAYDANAHDYRIYHSPDNTAQLYWDGSQSISNPDPFLKCYDFQGFRVYRSMNRGATWGEPVTNEKGTRIGWVPIAQFDKNDGIKGKDPIGGLNLGTDSGLKFSYLDDDLLNGVEYWYAVTAYDYVPADSLGGFDAMPSYESGIGSNPSYPSVKAVMAGTRPNGYEVGEASVTSGSALTPTAGGLNGGSVKLNVIDEGMLSTSTYTVSFSDTAYFGKFELPNMLGVTLKRGTETLYERLLPEDLYVGTDLLPSMDGVRLVVDTKFNRTTSDTRLGTTSLPTGLTAVTNRSQVYGDAWPETMFGAVATASTLDAEDVNDAGTYFFPAEIRFSTTTQQYAYVYTRDTDGLGADAGVYRAFVQVPFTVWDVSNPAAARQVNVAYTVNDLYGTNTFGLSTSSTADSSAHWLSILSSSYSATALPAYATGKNWTTDLDHVWIMWPYLTASAADVNALSGSTATLGYTKPISPATAYSFSTNASSYDGDEVDLDAIHVVPNPYYVRAEWDQSVNLRKVQFVNVPPNSTIDIYTVSGELVARLDHGAANSSDKVGIVDWKIWTYEFTEAAYGLYIYVVKTLDGKTHVGKFAIIR
jgi:hypothetical protein